MSITLQITADLRQDNPNNETEVAVEIGLGFDESDKEVFKIYGDFHERWLSEKDINAVIKLLQDAKKVVKTKSISHVS